VTGVSKAVELDECDIRRRRNNRQGRLQEEEGEDSPQLLPQAGRRIYFNDVTDHRQLHTRWHTQEFLNSAELDLLPEGGG
jgi:hypothetical protein